MSRRGLPFVIVWGAYLCDGMRVGDMKPNLGRLRRRLFGRPFSVGELAFLLIAVSCWVGVASSQAANAPLNTALPTISGTATQGQTLTEHNGAWDNNPVPPLTYQWEDCDGTGGSCTAIPGATDQTYLLTANDVNHTIVVQETATNTTGSTVASSNATGVVAALALPAPANTAPPTISGTTTAGQTLTEHNGAWDNNPVPPLIYQWEDCDSSGASCTAIPGAINQTYVLTANDVGHTIVVQETATNATGPAVASSNPTAVVAAPAPPAPANTALPTISGTTTQGQTLTETNGTWANNPVPPFTYQWEDCNSTGTGCTAIPGAINQTYLLTAADVGHTIVVQETATNVAGRTVASSAATAVVVPPLAPALPAPAIKAKPTVSGTATQGQTLTETNGTWDNNPTTVTNQWADCDSTGAACTPISGATGQTYTLAAGDVGHSILVQETATNATGRTLTSSGPTAVVTGPSADPSPVPSSTALTAVPNTAVTNEDVVLGATVTSAATPQGTITFNDDGTPISGCARLPVNSQPTIVTCETSFSASTSPEHLTAVFAPNAASGRSSAAGSTSPTQLLVVGRDSTSTAVHAPGASVRVGARTTYSASVTPSDVGSVHASGLVEFLDRGTPITSCASQPLIASNGATTATCSVSYKTTGQHVITASYAGDANFGASTAQPVSLGAAPIRILGTIISTMQWTFHYTPKYTTVLALVVNGAPVGATVLVQCHGGGCPFAKHANAVTKHKPVNLMLSFRRKRLRAGTQITVELSRPHWIGKDYRFTMRARHAPRIQIDCLAPAGSRPGVGC
jgi:Bacterial Ig-like domain (group 3)